MRRYRFIFHPRVGRDPVDLPGLASVVREGLLEMARRRSDVRDDEPHANGSAIQGLLIEELAASLLEFTDRGLAQGAVIGVGVIEAPLVGLGIVEAQRQTLDVTCRAI